MSHELEFKTAFLDEIEKLGTTWGGLFGIAMRGLGRSVAKASPRLARGTLEAAEGSKGFIQDARTLAGGVRGAVGQASDAFAAQYPRASKALSWGGRHALQGVGWSAGISALQRREQVDQVLPNTEPALEQLKPARGSQLSTRMMIGGRHGSM